MGTQWHWLSLLVLATVASSHPHEHSTFEDEIEIPYETREMEMLQSLNAQLADTHVKSKKDVDEITKMKNILGALTKQIMMAQLVREESMRSEGDSGVKQVRVGAGTGTSAYFTPTHSNQRSYMSIHDHSQNSRTQGMGEMVVVLNGVEFRTRHNDYTLSMLSKTDDTWGKTQDVPWPDVPPPVLNAGSVTNQIAEMKEWFKAWRNQDYSVRDYRPYFKPVISYLEGAWMSSTGAIEEPFESDRHWVDAASWWDLTEKIRFTGYSGRKENKENLSFQPMKIMNINNNSEPTFAQWNYRILCAPIEEDIPLMKLRVVDDLAQRMRRKLSLQEHEQTRAARYQLEDFNYGNKYKEFSYNWGTLDRIFEKLPGYDGWNGYLEDNAFNNPATHAQRPEELLNTAFYHRYYQSAIPGAMGGRKRSRGYSDASVFMAQTTRPNVPKLKVNHCDKAERGDKGQCYTYEQAWSYAIPLEIIYMTPLYNWNPYNLAYTEDKRSQGYKNVDSNGRNGGLTSDTAYMGTHRRVFYRTPAEFYEGDETTDEERDPADTSKGTVGVLDPQGNVRRVVASGNRILLPNIPGVGKLRTRYPIAPLFNDGNNIQKELAALKDLVLKQQTYGKMFVEPPLGGGGGGDEVFPERMYKFELADSDPAFGEVHTHEFEIPQSEVRKMVSKPGQYKFEVQTKESNGHSHLLLVVYRNYNKLFEMISCDGRGAGRDYCTDGHPKIVTALDY